jgi:preprotein translocase subunit SecG
LFHRFIDALMLAVAQAQPPQVQNIPNTKASTTNISNPVVLIILVIYFVVSACLVFTILSQTTKSEGLTGTIGGRTETVFKNKGIKSLEDKLEQITTGLAITFLVLSTLISIVGLK